MASTPAATSSASNPTNDKIRKAIGGGSDDDDGEKKQGKSSKKDKEDESASCVKDFEAWMEENVVVVSSDAEAGDDKE